MLQINHERLSPFTFQFILLKSGQVFGRMVLICKDLDSYMNVSPLIYWQKAAFTETPLKTRKTSVAEQHKGFKYVSFDCDQS